MNEYELAKRLSSLTGLPCNPTTTPGAEWLKSIYQDVEYQHEEYQEVTISDTVDSVTPTYNTELWTVFIDMEGYDHFYGFLVNDDLTSTARYVLGQLAELLAVDIAEELGANYVD